VKTKNYIGNGPSSHRRRAKGPGGRARRPSRKPSPQRRAQSDPTARDADCRMAYTANHRAARKNRGRAQQVGRPLPKGLCRTAQSLFAYPTRRNASKPQMRLIANPLQLAQFGQLRLARGRKNSPMSAVTDMKVKGRRGCRPRILRRRIRREEQQPRRLRWCRDAAPATGSAAARKTSEEKEPACEPGIAIQYSESRQELGEQRKARKRAP